MDFAASVRLWSSGIRIVVARNGTVDAGLSLLQRLGSNSEMGESLGFLLAQIDFIDLETC
jgi:hypothetical protein